MEIVVGGFGAIVLQLAPVEMVVVNECPVKNNTTVRLQRARDRIGRVGGRASVGRRAELTFGVSFDDKASEIGNQPVYVIHLLAPPLLDASIKRIEGVQAANCFRATK